MFMFFLLSMSRPFKNPYNIYNVATNTDSPLRYMIDQDHFSLIMCLSLITRIMPFIFVLSLSLL